MIVPTLTTHIVGNRLAHELYGIEDTYARVLRVYWVNAPGAAPSRRCWCSSPGSTAAWACTTGCASGPGTVARPAGFSAAAVAVPALALAGYVQGGIEVNALSRAIGFIPSATSARHADDPGDARRRADSILMRSIAGAHARGTRVRALPGTAGTRSITYPGWAGGRGAHRVLRPRGQPLRRSPHASVCGGRGRCSTCRARVARGLDAAAAERGRAPCAARVGAPPDVRLACQTPGRGTASRSRPAGGARRAEPRPPSRTPGPRAEIAVLFADLRGFTSMAEKRLPTTSSTFLNRYFEAVGTAIARAGGIANQFTGDGVMALFGVESGPETGRRQALAAARAMIAGVAALSRELGSDLPQPLRLGIGIHVGQRGGRTHGLRRQLLPHRRRRHGPRRRPARAGDEGLRLPSWWSPRTPSRAPTSTPAPSRSTRSRYATAPPPSSSASSPTPPPPPPRP